MSSGDDVELELQQLSKIVFGQRHRLALMISIARSSNGLINPTELAKELPINAQSGIQAPLKSLLDAELIARLSPAGQLVYYQRSESLAWAFAEELAAAAAVRAGRNAGPARR